MHSPAPALFFFSILFLAGCLSGSEDQNQTEITNIGAQATYEAQDAGRGTQWQETYFIKTGSNQLTDEGQKADLLGIMHWSGQMRTDPWNSTLGDSFVWSDQNGRLVRTDTPCVRDPSFDGCVLQTNDFSRAGEPAYHCIGADLGWRSDGDERGLTPGDLRVGTAHCRFDEVIAFPSSMASHDRQRTWNRTGIGTLLDITSVRSLHERTDPRMLETDGAHGESWPGTSTFTGSAPVPLQRFIDALRDSSVDGAQAVDEGCLVHLTLGTTLSFDGSPLTMGMLDEDRFDAEFTYEAADGSKKGWTVTYHDASLATDSFSVRPRGDVGTGTCAATTLTPSFSLTEFLATWDRFELSTSHESLIGFEYVRDGASAHLNGSRESIPTYRLLAKPPYVPEDYTGSYVPIGLDMHANTGRLVRITALNGWDAE